MAILAGQHCGGTAEEFSRPPALKFHQSHEGVVVRFVPKVGCAITKPGQIFLRKINSTLLQIASDVTDDVRHLQREAKLDRILFAGRITITKNFDAYEPDCAGDMVAVSP